MVNALLMYYIYWFTWSSEACLEQEVGFPFDKTKTFGFQFSIFLVLIIFNNNNKKWSLGSFF